jgi:hypothetical protein
MSTAVLLAHINPFEIVLIILINFELQLQMSIQLFASRADANTV